jgi:hypothetical protein
MKKMFKPFPSIFVPIFSGYKGTDALRMASQLSGKVSLLGLVEVPYGDPLSAGNINARWMRKEITKIAEDFGFVGSHHVSVSYNRWKDLQDFTQNKKPDLLVLDWPPFYESMGISYQEVLYGLNCNVAFVCGPWPEKIHKEFIPLRGGPHAQAALRLAIAIPHSKLSVLHLSGPDIHVPANDPFRGLANILPNLPEVDYVLKHSKDSVGEIVEGASSADVVVLGGTEQSIQKPGSLGDIADRFIKDPDKAVIVVKARVKAPTKYTGPEGERSGYGAISILVDKWFAENTYHSEEFDDIEKLITLKEAQNLTISLALPALNEEETVGNVIRSIQEKLVKQYPLLDEIILIDSNSTDQTRKIAEDLGIPVYIHQDLLPQYGARTGKGEALWKSLFVTRGDLIVWIDSDIVNIHPRFVYGVIGPLLVDPGVKFVKGFYQRPLKTERKIQSTGGGRVTELTARPLINLFYPELSGVIQPLSGEYGGRRDLLEKLTFYSGYGVETGLLIDAFEKCGLSAIAQTDLSERIHHNQSLEALSKMSFVIIQTVLRKLESRIHRPLLEEVNKSMKLIQYKDGGYYLDVQEIAERERPPMIEIPEYIEYQSKMVSETKWKN